MSPKLRGGRRYYARLQREAQTLVERVDAGEAFALWHHHFDYRGFGNGRTTVRRRHLRVLFGVLARLSRCERAVNGRLQVFASIAAAGESSEDALYLNSYGGESADPYRYPGVRWDVRPPSFLHTFVKDRGWRVGDVQHDDRRYWVVEAVPDTGLRD